MALAFMLLIIGAFLLCVEMFFPGFGVFGISGVVLVVISAILTLLSGPLGALIVLSEIVVLAVFIYAALVYVKNRQLSGKIILEDVLEYENPNLEDLYELVGRQGVVLTALRPIGTVDFDGLIMEVYAETGFISKDQYVKVIRIDKRKVFVKPV